MEEWKSIEELPSYQISSFGRIKHLDTYRNHSNQYGNCGSRLVKGKILKTQYSNRGYEFITLRLNGKKKMYPIHKLVAKCFVPNPHNYLYVNHKDGNKLNNNKGNLEWCTQSHNIKESYRLGLQKPYTPPMMPNYIPWNKGKKLK